MKKMFVFFSKLEKNCFKNNSFRKNLPSVKGVEGLTENIAKRRREMRGKNQTKLEDRLLWQIRSDTLAFSYTFQESPILTVILYIKDGKLVN